MFNLPKKFLFGDESKLAFKLSETEGIARLYSQSNIPLNDRRYWSSFLQLESASDVFSYLSLADVRKALDDRPENIETLVHVLTSHLESLLSDQNFSPPPPTNQNPLAVLSSWKIPTGFLPSSSSSSSNPSSSSSSSLDSRDRTREALNCARILTRVLPAIMERSNGGPQSKDLLWGRGPPIISDPNHSSHKPVFEESEDTTASQFVIDDEEELEEEEKEEGRGGGQRQVREKVTHDPLSASKAEPIHRQGEKEEEEEEGRENSPPLGERLIGLVVDLLFCSGFTIPWTEEQLSESNETNPSKVNYVIWQAGVGSSIELEGTNRSHHSHRVEFLRLLLVLLSKGLYVSPEDQIGTLDQALRFICTGLDRNVVLPLLCSLLNVSVNASTLSTSSWLDYSNPANLVGIKGQDPTPSMALLSIEVLNVLLSYDSPDSLRDLFHQTPPTARLTPSSARSNNSFRFYLSKLHRVADFDLMWKGLSRNLSDHIHSSNHVVPLPIPAAAANRRAQEMGAQGQNHVAETLMLLWKLLEHNPRFRSFVLEDQNLCPQLLSFLLHLSLNYKDSLPLQGLVRLCVFMLQDLSSESCFSTNISRPGSGSKVHLPNRFGVTGGGCATDFLIQSVYLLIATTKGSLSNLYPPLILSLTNSSPFWRSISVSSSTRMVQLLRSFSSANFLLAEEGNPRLVYYLLEAINGVVSHQLNSNPNLIYSILLSQETFEKLERFDLRRGLNELIKLRRKAGVLDEQLEGLLRRKVEDARSSRRLEEERGGGVQADSESRNSMGGVKEEEEEEGGEKGSESITTSLEKGKKRKESSSSSSNPPTSSEPRGEDEENPFSNLSEEDLDLLAGMILKRRGKSEEEVRGDRSEFLPTQGWVQTWNRSLPLSKIQRLILSTLPGIRKICEGGNQDQRILALLRELDPEILLEEEGESLFESRVRRWNWTPPAWVWFRSFLWGRIYVHSLLPFSIWSGTRVRLFRIHQPNGGGGSDSSQDPIPNPSSIS
ncbi:hypothetical protein IE53DRAFT_390420 [Violaceomyces palustris]|uniref:Uncharacterized protein n=1 Tax=Violaceomyces palustris TaxID=1673888 RepID=A0ACD0NNQ4_9BASI|nr:hypothetical protein IE53DRAFT_390420 [Violaceomyces palustris]